MSTWVEPFILFQNLPPGDCRQRAHSDFTCSKTTSRGLSDGRASSFMVFKTFSRGLSAQGYRLFIRLKTYFQSSKSVVLSVYKVYEPTCRELSA